MKCLGTIALGVAITTGGTTIAADRVPQTPPELRGIWVFDQGDAAGDPAPTTREVKQSRMEIAGDKFIETWQDAAGQTKRSENRVQIDSSKSPKQITLYSKCDHCTTDGQRTEWAMPGIYRVDGDVLTISMGVVRPTEFDSPCSAQIVFKKLPDSTSTQVRQASHGRRPRLLLSHLGRRIRR